MKIDVWEDGNPSAIEICESFGILIKVYADQTAAGLSSHVVEIFESKGLPLGKYRGQGYNEARTIYSV